MDSFFKQFEKNDYLHHFYVIEGESAEVVPQLSNFLEKKYQTDLSDKTLFNFYTFNNFLVEDSRQLLGKAQIKTPLTKKMIFIISINSITRQAQNALLKLLEEPTARTYFFLILPRVDNLLTTLTSRAVLIKKNQSVSENILDQFRQKTATDRLEFVNDLIKDIKNEKQEKIVAQRFIRNLIVDFEVELQTDELNKEKIGQILKTLTKIEDYLNDSGASTKILLERAVLLI